MKNDYSRLTYGDHFLAYHSSNHNKKDFGVVFFGGFMSDMQGSKASAVERYCAEHHVPFVKFDYFGHGKSSGKFIDGAISLWLDNCLQVLDQLTKGPQLIVGSSMGGWLMLLAALKRPERIASLIGIAAAPDFTEDIFNCMSDEQKFVLAEKHLVDFVEGEDSYPISLNLIEDGRKHLLLGKKIGINIGTILLHGMEDKSVNFTTSIKIAQNMESKDVEIYFVKGAEHRFSSEDNLNLLYSCISKSIARL